MKSQILIIDNDPDMITLGTILLELDDCCDIFSAQSGPSGLKILNQVDGVDLILLDMNLRGLSSREVLAVIKNNEAYAYIPVIMIADRSQVPTESHIVSYFETIDGYIEKPFVVKDFWQEIKPFLDKSSPQSAYHSRQNHSLIPEQEIDSQVDLNQAGLSAQQFPVCSLCLVKHAPEAPHYKDSLYYQCMFHSKHGRWPTWTDAAAHCH